MRRIDVARGSVIARVGHVGTRAWRELCGSDIGICDRNEVCDIDKIERVRVARPGTTYQY